MSKKRIIEEQATTDIFNDDWLVKDSVTQGTTKIQLSVFKAWINDGMATEEDIETIVENIADTYSTLESYAEGDLCIHEYALFKCIGATTGTWDSTKWEATTIAEIIATIDLSAEAISYDNTSSGLEAENVQDAIDEVVADVNAVETALETKAEQNGIYDDLVVGTAQNLLSESFTEDKVPYNFRQSFNGARLEDEIVGGTVAWNQLVQNGNFADGASGWSEFQLSASVSNNVATCTVSSTGNGSLIKTFSVNQNHIYLVNTQVKGTNGNTVRLRGDGSMSITTQETTATTFTQLETVGKASSTGNYRFIVTGVNANSVFNTKNCNCIDLTQMFGSTIADYIYSLEQATAGSGVAYFRNLFPKSYYAYNSGALMSVNASSHNTVEKNLFNIDAEHTIGATYPYTLKVKPNTAYTVSSNVPYANPASLYFNGGSTVTNSVYNEHPITSVSDNDGNLIIYVRKSAGDIDLYTAVKNGTYWIQLEEGSTATAYEPYTKHTYPLDSDLTLRGIPKLDSNNNLYYDGDIYKSDGGVTRRYGVVDLGTLSWSKNTISDYTFFYANVISNKKKNGPCATYSFVNKGRGDLNDKEIGTWNVVNSFEPCIRDDSKANLTESEFKQAMSGIYLVYELTTPTSETADAFINPQIVDARGTEEYVDYAESQGTRDVAIPVGHNSKYYADLKSKIENIPDVPGTNGTYTLKATRSASGVTYAWVSG